MANKRMFQFLYSENPMLSFLEGSFTIGASGAVGTVKGVGIRSVTQLDAGRYQITLNSAFNRYLGGYSGFVAPVTGSALDPQTAPLNITYIITTVGNTPWSTLGLNPNVVPAVGVSFQLLSNASAGTTGRLMAVGAVGLNIEVVGDANLTLPSLSNNAGHPYLIIQCVGPTSAGSTVPLVQNPPSGSVLGFSLFLRNSSINGIGQSSTIE